MNNDFSSAISEIMPLVNDSDKSTPFIITQDKAHGGWQVCYPYPAEKAESFLASRRERDYLAVMFTGADFAKGSFSYVYDKILYARLRDEYYLARSSGLDTDELHAMCCFMQDYIGEFSHEVTDYLTTLDRPLAALVDMCPYGLTTDNPNRAYNEDFAVGAIHYIENEVNDRLHSYPDERLPEPRYIDGCEVKQNVTIGKIEVVIAENLNAAAPYLVCNIDGNGEAYNHSAYTGYVQAMDEFLTRQTELFGVIKSEREQRGEHWLEDAMLKPEHCLPGSARDDFTGKLIIVKASELSPECRYSDSQLVECTHGNGARPDAIGTSVFGKELYSGQSVAYGRHQILGIADETKLPQWAKVKLEIQRDQTVFAFGGYHFKPHRSFEKHDGDFFKQTCNCGSDRAMGISQYEWGKAEYSHEKFYEAAHSEADIFKCLENGKLYVPCENELFRYNEPPVKTRETPKQQEPKAENTLLGEVREAGEIAKRRETERGNAAVSKKLRENGQNEH